MAVKSLSALFHRFPYPAPSLLNEIMITGVVSDSRQVQPGNLFVACKGDSTDGHRYIPDAIDRGAAAVAGDQDQTDLPVPYIRLQDARQALAHLAAGFFDYPAQRLTIIGVTGTDGKTTTSNLIFQILKSAGIRAGMISTVNAVIGDTTLDTGFHVTTPDSPDIQKYLAQMVSSGLTHVVLEATSHGLAQHRVDASEPDIAVITNITHEHLDYHGTEESYRAAKARLFTELGKTTARKESGIMPTAVLNRDDQSYAYLAQVLAQLGQNVKLLRYGVHFEADLRAEEISFLPSGLQFHVIGPGLSFPVSSPLVGLFNVSNCLAAIGATVGGLGLEISAAQEGLRSFPGVPGRMERLDLGQDFIAIVDFAHTPNALRNALQTVREMTAGRVIAVFGSAGLRDRYKRRMMAEVSAELAELTVLTAEDPRTEDLDGILEEMAAGAKARGGVEEKTFWRIADRRDALRFAVSIAQPEDVVIACGKGHEQSMCFGTTEYAWDDRQALRAALSELLQVPGPEMPYLPTSR